MIQFMSDVHLDARNTNDPLPIPEALEWVENLPVVSEILVLAGDVHSRHIARVLGAFSKKWRLVVFVPGNHDYWGQRFQYQWARFQRIEEIHPNVRILREKSFLDSVSGLTFHGTTLWFPWNSETSSHQNLINDFTKIKESHRLFDLGSQARDFLRSISHNWENDIIISHHAPSSLSVALNWKDHPATPYYLTPFLDLLPEGVPGPKVWIHGHMHDPNDYIHPCGTRVLSNPAGYDRSGIGFDPAKTTGIF
jgi:predicted MPP superfamily phosphohydrolase